MSRSKKRANVNYYHWTWARAKPAHRIALTAILNGATQADAAKAAGLRAETVSYLARSPGARQWLGQQRYRADKRIRDQALAEEAIAEALGERGPGERT